MLANNNKKETMAYTFSEHIKPSAHLELKSDLNQSTFPKNVETLLAVS